MVRLLGPYSKVFPLQQELVVLLKDESAEVVQGIVKNLNETLTVREREREVNEFVLRHKIH